MYGEKIIKTGLFSKINGDLLLFITLVSMDLFLLPSIFDTTAKLNVLTTVFYTFFLFVAGVSYYMNKQKLPFIAQMIGCIEWIIMIWKSVN